MSQRQESAAKDDAFATDINQILTDKPDSTSQKTNSEMDEL